MTWRITGGPWNAPAPTVEFLNLHGRKLTFQRGGPAAFECNVAGRDPEAAHFVDLFTDLHVFRGEDTAPFFRGRVALTGDEIDENNHDVKVTAGDYRAVLARRFLYDEDPLINQDVGIDGDVAAITADLIELTQGRPAGGLGITLGHGFPTSAALIHNLKLSAGTSIAQAIDVMADTDRTISGFDWEVDAHLALNLWVGRRGADGGVVLEYGSNVARVSRTGDPASFANVLRGNGSQGSGIAQTVEAEDILTRPEGRWEAQIGFPDVNTFPVLETALSREFARRDRFRSSYKVKLKPGYWQGPGHLWLGDRVRFLVESGRLHINEEMSVDTIALEATDDGDELVTLDLVEQTPGVIRRLANFEERLRILERN